MEYEYTKKFEKDLQRYKNNPALIRIIGKKIKHIIRSASIDEIQELVPIRKKISRYRIKIRLAENRIFRIGIVVLKNTVWFACIDKDKKRFYKRFR